MNSNRSEQKKVRRDVLVFFLIVALGLIWYLDYRRTHDEARVQVVFSGAGGALSSEFNLETARTAAERERGLMYRKPGTLGANEGMIFIFPQEQVQAFWMKNTFIPLDMIFVNNQLEVVGVLEQVPVLNEQRRSVSRPSRYVIELLAGTAQREKITTGSRVIFRGKSPGEA